MSEVKIPKELADSLAKAEAKAAAARKKIAEYAKQQKAKSAAAALVQEQRKDALICEMAKTTLAAELVARMDAYLVHAADRALFGLPPRV